MELFLSLPPSVFNLDKYKQSQKFADLILSMKEDDENNNNNDEMVQDLIFSSVLGTFFRKGHKCFRGDLFSSLFIWVLYNMSPFASIEGDKIAMLILKHARYPMALCLVACNILRKRCVDEKLSDFSAVGMALKSKASAFECLAKRILEKCHEKSEIRAKFLLLDEIATLGPSSCLQLAIHGKCQEFVSDEACRQLFDGIES